MKPLEITVSIISLLSILLAIFLFMYPQGAIRGKLLIAKIFDNFWFYANVSECSPNENKQGKFGQGVFDLGKADTLDTYKGIANSGRVITVSPNGQNRNLYSSVEDMQNDLPSYTAQPGDLFLVAEANSKECKGDGFKGQYNSYVKGVIHTP